MQDCHLDDQYPYELFNSLKNNAILIKVDLSKNKLNDVGEYLMEDMITQNK